MTQLHYHDNIISNMIRTTLQDMAEEFEKEINKIHSMVIDLPEELWIKEQLVNQVNLRAKKFYDDYSADYMTP